MSTAIYKYVLPVDDRNHLIPGRIEFVSALDEVTLNVWCIVDPDDLSDTEPYRVFGTGQRIPNLAIYNGTALAAPFVWHVFNMVDVEDGDL